MIKRIISLLMLLCMVASALPAAAEQTTEVAAPKGVELLAALGVEINENYSETVTRAALAQSVVSFAGDQNIASVNQYFTDVTSSQWSSGVGAASLNGYMVGMGDGIFRPQAAASVKDALSVILRVAGFANAVYSDAEYVKYARDYKLLKNVTQDVSAELNYSELYTMMYNALFLPVVEIHTIGVNAEYKINRDTELLAVLYDAYEGEGIVTAHEYAALSGNPTGEGMIEIDNVEYRDKAGIGKKLFAYMIRYYYIDREDGDKPELVYAEPYKKTETESYSLEDLTVSGDAIQTDINGRIKTLKISDFAAYIVNGCPATKAGVHDAIENSDGSIEFIDYDGDREYDAVIASVMTFLWVQNKNNTEMSLTGFEDEGTLVLDSENEEIITIYKNGALTDFAGIAHYDTLEIYTSGDERLIDVYASADRVLGVAQGLDLDERVATIEGKEYKIPRRGAPRDFTTGKRGVFYISTSGYLVACEMFDFEYGYLLRSYESIDDDRIHLKVLNTLGEIEQLLVSEKCQFDNTETPLFLDDISGKQLIRYKCNSKGEVKNIATAVNNQNGSYYNDTCFTRDATADFTVRLVNPVMVGTTDTNTMYFINEQTVIFKVPTDENAVDEDYRVISKGSLTSDQKVNMEIYDSDKYSIPKVIVLNSSALSNPNQTTSLFILKKMYQTIDEFGDVVVKLEGMQSNKEVSYTLSDRMQERCYGGGTARYKFGDVMQLNVDDNNYVTQIVDIMVGDERNGDWIKIQGADDYALPLNYTPSSTIHYYDDRCLMFGHAKNVKNVELVMGVEINNPNYNVYRIAAMNKAVYTIIDFGENEIKAGTASDVGDGSLVLIRNRRQDVGDMVIFKDAR